MYASEMEEHCFIVHDSYAVSEYAWKNELGKRLFAGNGTGFFRQSAHFLFF